MAWAIITNGCPWLLDTAIRLGIVRKSIVSELFMFAASDGRTDAIRGIHGYGQIATYTILNAFNNACARDDIVMASHLHALGLTIADIRANDAYAFRTACSNGSLRVAEWIFGLGLDLDDVHQNKSALLMRSAVFDYLDMVQWMIALDTFGKYKASAYLSPDHQSMVVFACQSVEGRQTELLSYDDEHNDMLPWGNRVASWALENIPNTSASPLKRQQIIQ